MYTGRPGAEIAARINGFFAQNILAWLFYEISYVSSLDYTHKKSRERWRTTLTFTRPAAVKPRIEAPLSLQASRRVTRIGQR